MYPVSVEPAVSVDLVYVLDRFFLAMCSSGWTVGSESLAVGVDLEIVLDQSVFCVGTQLPPV